MPTPPQDAPVERRTFVLVMIGLVVVTAALVAVASFGLETQSQVRAYVGGEARWSKAQKSAVHALSRYAGTHDEADYQRYRAALEVPLGDRRARLELEKPSFDLRVVREGFVAGGNAPEDVDGMASLYRRFHSLDYIEKSVRIWSAADDEIAALQVAAERLHRATAAGAPEPEVKAILADIEELDRRVTVLENDFSDTLGEAARWLSATLLKVLVGAALLLVAGVGRLLWHLFESLHRTEIEVRRSEAIHRSLVKDSPVGIGRSRHDGTLEAVNPALVAMLGYADDAELLAKNLSRDIYEDADTQARILARLASGGTMSTETTWRKKDGRTITVRISGREVVATSGANESLTFTVEDVTETRLLQEQVRQAQKMEAVGQLAGGIAHDFNNLLTAILGSAALLLDELPKDHPAYEDAEQVHAAGLRAAELTRQLLAFGRKQALAPRRLDFNAVLEGMRKIFRSLIGPDIALELVLESELAPIRADQGQLEQVLVNLAVNARDAMPEGGVLTVATANVPRAEVPENASLPSPSRDHMRLRVTDTGIGMDSATLDHLFEPFFTTKPRGRGTGLGLATVHGIVHQSGGRIHVRSERGHGATFDIYLPTDPGTLDKLRSAAPRARARGDETILVVEDQEQVRKLTSRVLRAQGYTVLEAEDGVEALRVAEEHAGTIHLLATDVVMPGMSGREVANQLTQTRPALRVLYLSGYAGDVILRHGVLEPGIALLPKPFTAEGLARKVRDVLDAVV